MQPDGPPTRLRRSVVMLMSVAEPMMIFVPSNLRGGDLIWANKVYWRVIAIRELQR